MTDASETARIAQRLPEDALAQCFATLEYDAFVAVRGVIVDAAIDEVDRLLGNTHDSNVRRLGRAR